MRKVLIINRSKKIFGRSGNFPDCCELACEWTDRFEDLKRWGDYDKINAPLHGRIHTNKTDLSSHYTIQTVWAARNFNPDRDMAWPIDPDEISRSNGVYKQTPGW